MIQFFKQLVVSAFIPLLGAAPVNDSAQIVITVKEKTFLIKTLTENGTYTQSGSTKKHIQLRFNANGRLIEESSPQTGNNDLRLWGLFDPDYFQLMKFEDGSTQIKLGSTWDAMISSKENFKIELIQTESDGTAAIEVWIPKSAEVTLPDKLSTCR